MEGDDQATSLRYMVHFMHDYHLVVMLDFLGMLENGWANKNPSPFHRVNFTSSLRFEILTATAGNLTDVRVRVSFDDYTLRLPFCDGLCKP